MINSTATVSELTHINNQNNIACQPLSYEFQTTQMLKMLDRIFPNYEWTSDWLKNNVKENGACTFKNSVSLSYVGQPFGKSSQHLYRITFFDPKWAEKAALAYNQINSTAITLKTPVERSTYSTQEGTYQWNGLYLRSKAEIEIAKALESKGIFFFANARCRVVNRLGLSETKETDFLVFHKGNPRILEVDGQEYHQQRGEDYRRDRLFDKQGILTTRFTASECLKNPDEVIEEFLSLF
jgi:hypothetical protein